MTFSIMTLYWAFVFLTIIISSTTSSNKRRIHYGEKSTTIQPFLASILWDRGAGIEHYKHLCGGLIFTEYYVVTAAHCIADRGNDLNYVGVEGLNFHNMGSYHKIIDRIAHPDYIGEQIQGSWLLDADIGLVKTETRINHVPVKPYDPSLGSLENKPLIIYGWGTTETGDISEDLNQLNLEFTSDFYHCENDPSLKAGRSFCFWAQQGKQTGPGDSGSPIMLQAENSYEGDTVVSVLSGTSGPFSRNGMDYYMAMGPNFTYFLPWLTESTN